MVYFPQIKGLGKSEVSVYYSIENLEEAREYLKNEYLKFNLLEITQALLDLDNNNAVNIFGYPDVYKLKSCMTLFHYADPTIILFKEVIDKFYNGDFDTNTIDLINEIM